MKKTPVKNQANFTKHESCDKPIKHKVLHGRMDGRIQFWNNLFLYLKRETRSSQTKTALKHLCHHTTQTDDYLHKCHLQQKHHDFCKGRLKHNPTDLYKMYVANLQS